MITIDKITTEGEPRVGGGTFFGYQYSKLGPGPDAFQKCLNLAETNHRPLLFIWGKDSCEQCDQFAKMANTYQRIFSPLLGSYKVVAGYFRGDDTGDGPEACLDAKNFFSDSRMAESGGLKGSCHCIGFYGVFDDRTIFARSDVLSTSDDLLETRTNFTNTVGGWVQEYETLSKQHTVQYRKLDAFDDVLRLSNANGRPILAFYGRAGNGGINDFNTIFSEESVLHIGLIQTSRCQIESFDPSVTKYGFYYVYYCNDRNETVEEANKVKQFITQFGPITTGYPWYIVYHKRNDGSIYARYGSWNATKAEKNKDQYFNLYNLYMNRIISFGKEIKYVWTNGIEPTPQPQKKYQISFDANGGSGSLASIEVGEERNAFLPSYLEVTSKIFKTGFSPIKFQDKNTRKEYQFSDIILSVKTNMTLLVVFEKIEDKKDDIDDKDDDKDDDDKKIKINGKTQSYTSSQFPLSHQYQSTGMKTIRISNNLSTLVVRGDIANPNVGMESQIVYAKFSPKLSAVPDYCFANCTNLGGLDSDNNIKSVGDYAFYNCKNLKSANFLGNANKVLTYIGDYAFAGSGLSSVIINLQGSISNSSTNTHCFANCKELTSVDMTNSTYLADHMFDGCSMLQKVHLNNYHSYINEYAFANCTTLTSMTFPQKTYMLPNHMFDGCINLMEVKFEEPSDLRQLGEGVFSGCSRLTSITLPASVNDLEYIDPLFLSGSSIDRVVFNGISDDVFADEIKEPKEYALPPSVLYQDAGKIKTILKDVLTSNIPVIAIRSNDNGCPICESYKDAIYGTSKFKKWLTTQNKYYWVLAYYDSNNAGFNAITDFLDKHCNRWGTHYLQVGFYWKKDDGTEVTAFFEGSQAYSGKYSSIDKYIDQLENHVFKGYEGESEIVYVTKDEITTFGRGQDLSVTFVSSTGKEWICANDSVIYIPETRVDHYTTSDFKYGIWYHNIKELKAFADANHLPLFLEFGSKGCDPCKDFKKNTFNNKNFQDQITSKPCLLSKIEIGNGESFNYPTTTQAYYASHDFGDPNTLIPQLVFYWNKSSGETYKQIWNYNYRTDPGNANYETVLKKIDAMLGSYQADPRFLAPTIDSFQNGKYNYYQRDSEDDVLGKYFICDKKTQIQDFSGSIVLETGNILGGGVKEKITLTGISIGDVVNVPDGAYQYFTVDDQSRYYDLSGVIFTIDGYNVIGLCRFENEANYQYDVEDTSDFGYWVHFSDSSSEDTLQNLIALSESKDYPTIFFERPATVEAIVVTIPKTGNADLEETINVRIDIDSATSKTKIESLVEEALGPDKNIKSISNIDDLLAILKFNTQIRYNPAFTNWAKKKKYVLVDVASDSWTFGAPKKMRDFEENRNFDENSISDPLPKFLIYLACSSCTTDGSLLIDCKKKIAVDYNRDINYYTQLVEAYVDL